MHKIFSPLAVHISTTHGKNDAREKWQDYVRRQMLEELGIIVRELNLRPGETASFVRTAFDEGGASENGTAVNETMCPMSRFFRRRGDGCAAAKAKVIERLKAHYERFADIAPPEA